MAAPFVTERRRGSRLVPAMTTRPRSFARVRSALCPWTCAEQNPSGFAGYVTVRIGLPSEKTHLASRDRATGGAIAGPFRRGSDAARLEHHGHHAVRRGGCRTSSGAPG